MARTRKGGDPGAQRFQANQQRLAQKAKASERGVAEAPEQEDAQLAESATSLASPAKRKKG